MEINPDNSRSKKDRMKPDLFKAVIDGDVEEFKAALEAGADINEQHAGMLDMTPLHLACIYNREACVDAAIAHGKVNPWIWDANVRVAFDHASAKNNKPIMRKLYDIMYPEGPSLEEYRIACN